MNKKKFKITKFFDGVSGEKTKGLNKYLKLGNSQNITIDLKNNVYVAETENYCIRKISQKGESSFLFGPNSPGEFIIHPYGITLNSKNDIFITDCDNHYIRKISQNGIICNFAGTKEKGYKNGDKENAQFNFPLMRVKNEQENADCARIRCDSGLSRQPIYKRLQK